MDKDELKYLIEQLKYLEEELVRCETLSDRKIVREDIKKIKQQLGNYDKSITKSEYWRNLREMNPESQRGGLLSEDNENTKIDFVERTHINAPDLSQRTQVDVPKTTKRLFLTCPPLTYY